MRGELNLKKKKEAKLPDIPAIMIHLRSALALVTVAHKSLDADDAETAASPECAVLEQGIAQLREVYNELDMADIQLRKVLGQ